MSQRKRVTRRSFLKGATAAVAAPYFVPASALGKGGFLPPSERITIGFIGVGNKGRGHLNTCLKMKQLQVVAISDVDASKREKYQKRVNNEYANQREAGSYKGCDVYNEFEELLARPDIDTVLAATPDHWHALIALATVRAGKDIYAEKPLSLTIDEAWKMVDGVRRYGRVFQTGSQQRSDKKFRHACEIVRNERIGKLLNVTVSVGPPSQEKYLPEEPIPEGFDWDRWQGPTQWQPYNSERCSGDYGGGWRRIRDYSGGLMTDWGAHHFDIVQWALGMDGSGPVEIHPPDGKDYKTLTYKYANGVTMQLGDVNGILFTGTKGKVEVDRGYIKTWPDSILREPIGPNDVRLYNSPDHMQNWIDCVRSRQRPICDVEIGASSVTVCHIGNIAWWLGRPMKWDPVKREFIGDDEANRWRSHPYRRPWRL